MARQTHKNIVWTYVNLIVGSFSPFILIPLFTRLLGHELYGQYVVITSLSYYLGLANLGIGQTIANRIAAAVANRQDSEVAALVSTAFYTLLVIAAALLVLLLILTRPLWPYLVGSPDPAAMTAFFAIFVLSLIAFPFKAQNMLLRGYQRVDREQAVWATLGLVRMGAMALALVSGLRLIAIASIHGAVGLASGICCYLLALRLSPAAKPAWRDCSWRLLRGMVAPSVAFLVLQVSSTLATRIDNLVIGSVLGAEPVTLYSVPYRLMLMVILLFTMMQNALQPTITAHYARDNRALLRQAYSFLMRLAMLYAVAASIALWLVGPAFIRLWAGHGVYPGATVFGLQIAFTALQIALAPAEMVLWSTSRHHLWATIALVEGALNLGLSIWWVHRWGLAGVIGASIVARLMTNAWYLPMAASVTVGASLPGALRRAMPAAALSALALAALAAVWALAAPMPIGAAIGTAAALVIVFAAAFARFAFTSEERRTALVWLTPRSWANQPPQPLTEG